MTLKKSIEQLQKSGVDIVYRKRSDGGIIVKEINGVKFKGAVGNAVVRQMTGTELSERQIKQLTNISLPMNVQKAMNRAQRAFRAARGREETAGRYKIRGGTVGKKNVLYTMKTYGEEEALRRLSESELYGRGYAPSEYVYTLHERFKTMLFDMQRINDEILKGYIQQLYDYTMPSGYEMNTRILDSTARTIGEMIYPLENAIKSGLLPEARTIAEQMLAAIAAQ